MASSSPCPGEPELLPQAGSMWAGYLPALGPPQPASVTQRLGALICHLGEMLVQKDQMGPGLLYTSSPLLQITEPCTHLPHQAD